MTRRPDVPSDWPIAARPPAVPAPGARARGRGGGLPWHIRSEARLRRKHQRAHHRHSLRRVFDAGGAAVPAAAGDAPSLHMPEPASATGAWVSGGLSALVHVALLVALALSAWFAPQVVDEIIPVRILKEAPPSDLEPAPAAPKVLAPRRPVMASPSVAPRALPRAPVPQPAAVAQVVPTETVQMARIEPARAPAQVEQRQVQSDVVRAVRSPVSNTPSPIAVAPTAPIAIAPSAASVMNPSRSGPVAVAPTRNVAVGSPQAFSSLGDANANDYAASAEVPARSITGTQPTSEFGVASDFTLDTVDRIGGGGGTGGAGSSEGTARCLESVYTQNYYNEEVKPRVQNRWLQDELPASARPGDEVVLNFVLDASGSATQVTVRSAPNRELGISCVRAMRDASPFPALGNDLRCLAGKKLRATFKVPEAG